MRLPDRAIRFGLKPALFLAGLGPAAVLAWGAYTGDLTADPLAELTNQTGIWTLRFLCITLALTPLRRLTGWNAVIRFRRMAGLFAFFYGSVHLLVYVVFDRLASLGVDIPGGIVAWTTLAGLATSVGQDIYKRPFITMGSVRGCACCRWPSRRRPGGFAGSAVAGGTRCIASCTPLRFAA